MPDRSSAPDWQAGNDPMAGRGGLYVHRRDLRASGEAGMTGMTFDPKDVHIRVIDQRIGMGVGGRNTVMRLYHIPTGILIEVPRITSSQTWDREIALEMLEAALTHPKCEAQS
jgi:protein subunit release factor A